ncbi:MAG: ABC transporter substrate-binding protein [Fervidicoccaceae archaeon]
MASEKKGISGYIYAIMVALLLIGVAVGFVAGRGAAPTPVIKTTTITVTATAAPVGLTGEVKIGALLPLTGVLSTFGAQFRESLLLAEKEINDYLNAIGRPWRIKFVIEDTATDPKTHLDKLQALHGAGIKIFVGGASSAELRESLGYVTANKLLIISPSSTSPALALKDTALRFTPNDVYQGKAIADVLWQRGVRWVAPVWRGDTWGDGLKEYTIKRFLELCGASKESCGVLEGIRYDPAAKEFSAEAAKLNAIVRDAVAKYGKDKVGVLAIGFEETAALVLAAKAYPALSEVVWQGSDGTAGISQFLDPSIADFVVKTKMYNTMASPGVSPHADKVRDYIKQKLGMDPIGYAYFVYDIAWTLALALDAVGKYDPIAVYNALPLVLKHYIGASGYIELDENGDRSVADFDLWVVTPKDGTYVWKIAGLYKGLTGTVEWYS